MPRARGMSRLNIGPPSPRASATTRSPRLRTPVLGVGHGALEDLLDQPGAAVGRTSGVAAPRRRTCRGSGRRTAGSSGPTCRRSGVWLVYSMRFSVPVVSDQSQIGSGVRPRLVTDHCSRSLPDCRGPPRRPCALPPCAPERPGRGELAELVADHVLGHVQLDEVPAVVDGEVLADELGHDRAGPRPGLDRLVVLPLLLDLLEQPLDRRTGLSSANVPWYVPLRRGRVRQATSSVRHGRVPGSSVTAGPTTSLAVDDRPVRGDARGSTHHAVFWSGPAGRRRMIALFDGLRVGGSCRPWPARRSASTGAGRPWSGPRRRPSGGRPGSSPCRGRAACGPATASARPCRG